MSNIASEKFVKLIENWVFKNDKKFAEEIKMLKGQIPATLRKGAFLYRGMTLSEDMIEAIKNGYDKFKMDGITSWTHNEKVAERFVKDTTKSVSKDKLFGKGIIFKKRITDTQIILDVYNYLVMMDMMGILSQYDFDELTKEDGLDEFEVLVDKGITLKKADIFKIIR